MNEFTPDEICAKLTTGACPRKMFPQLKYNQSLREKVIERLDNAGYQFVDDPISNSYDARIKSHIRSLHNLVGDELGSSLTTQAKAIIAILWCYLIFPKINRAMKMELKEEPTVTEEQLYENFKQHIGSRQNLRRTLTLLRQYNFIEGIWGQKNTLKAGPRLSSAIDAVVMYDLLKDKVIDFIISEEKEEVENAFVGLEELERDYNQDFGEKGDDYTNVF